MLAVGYASSGAAIYIPSMNKWVKTTVPSGFNTGDMAGISQMFDGRVYVYGLNSKAYIWTPGAGRDRPRELDDDRAHHHQRRDGE